MGNNLFVSYDLHTPGQNYESVIAEIKRHGTWARVHYSLFYVRSTKTANELGEAVWKVMDQNDRLIVVDATTNNAVWYNLDAQVSELMRTNWHK